VLRAAIRAGVRRVVMTSAANAASPASYASDGITDETLWTVDDPSLPAYRRSKTLAKKAAWDFMAGHDGPTTRVPRAAEPAQHRQGARGAGMEPASGSRYRRRMPAEPDRPKADAG
jgi:hypothetical protein